MVTQSATELSVDAYFNLADVLVNFRHILLRALKKKHGARWFEVACPPEVFERLARRKEEELEIDRYSREYEELIDFADFHDMAEIIFMVEDVADLLRRLASSLADSTSARTAASDPSGPP